MKKRIVITGLGVLAANAKGRADFWQALKAGQSGIGPITLFNADEFPVKQGGEVKDFDPKVYMGPKGLRTLDRSTKLLVSAAIMARDDSGLVITDDNTDDIGVSTGTTLGSLQSIVDFDKVILTEGPRYTNPAFFPNTVMNSPSSQVSIWLNIQGFNTTIANGFTASLDAMKYAYDFIQFERVKVVLAGGVEDFSYPAFWGFCQLKYLSGSRKSGSFINCPFDRRRNGAVLAEAACLLVLEEYEHARARGAKILGEILSFGMGFFPARSQKRNASPMGLKEAMKQALAGADLKPDDIDYICANANSTPEADKTEARAIKEIFGEYGRHVPVSAVKSMVGETYSVSGSLAVASALATLTEGFIPPTINYQQPDPDCDLNIVANKALPAADIDKIMVVNFSPTGNNSCLILGKVPAND